MAQSAFDDFMMHAMIWAAGVEKSASNDDQTETDLATAVEGAEAFILSRSPRNAAEMIVQLEIICHDLDEGRRTDGLDVQALRNIQRALHDGIAQERLNDLAGFLAVRERTSQSPHGSDITYGAFGRARLDAAGQAAAGAVSRWPASS